MIQKRFSDLRKEKIHVVEEINWDNAPIIKKISERVLLKTKPIHPSDFEKIFGKALPQIKPQTVQDIEIEISEKSSSPTQVEIPAAAPLISLDPNIPPLADTTPALVRALENIPKQMVDLMKHLPVPVISPRPPGAWVIDVERDSSGTLSRMIAQFHETTEQTTEQTTTE